MNKIEMPLSNGKVLVAERNPNICYDEIIVYISSPQNGAEQDLVLIRESLDKFDPVQKEFEPSMEVLVWGDEYNEDYTDEFTIPFAFDDKGELKNG